MNQMQKTTPSVTHTTGNSFPPQPTVIPVTRSKAKSPERKTGIQSNDSQKTIIHIARNLLPIKQINKLTILLLCLTIITTTTGCGLFQKRTSRRAVEHYASALALEAADLEEDAIVQLRQAVQLDSEFGLAHSRLGELYMQEGRYDRAAQSFENACQLDPYAFNDHLHLGQVYRILEKFDQAIQTLRRACQLNPESSEANFSLGATYYDNENYELAEAFCKRATQLEPDNGEILACLGDIYGKTGNEYEAIDAYRRSLELTPDQVEVMLRLGMTYLRQRRYQPAQFILERAANTAPDRPEPSLSLGYCMLCQQDLNAALNYYSHAYQLAPQSPEALNGVGVTKMMIFLDNQQDPQLAVDALEFWHRSLEINPNQPKIRNLVARYNRDWLNNSPQQPGNLH